MLIQSARVINTPVLSLHVGGPIARTVDPIINPHTLQIVAFTVSGPAIDRDPEIGDLLDIRSIREFSRLGMIINSTDDLISREDAVRLNEVIKLNFHLIGLKVVTKKGSRLGKVVDYILDPESMHIIHLIVQRPALKAIVDPELTIHKSQIAKVTDDEIVVKEEEQTIREQAVRDNFTPNFVNPFRKPRYAPAQNQSPDELDKQ